MKLLVDAQLPRRLAIWLKDAGHEALHTLDLPQANLTPDAEVIAVADRDGRIVVTKDDDFVQSFLIQGKPQRLLLISTGNISNNDLLALISKNIEAITRAFESAAYVEIGRESLVVHG